MNDETAVKPHFLVGLDLGQARDHTAISVIQQRPGMTGAMYDVSHLERMQEPYPQVVRRVSELLNSLRDKGSFTAFDALGRGHVVRPDLDLVIDGTGVGVAVVDLFREADLAGKMIAVTITGGDNVNRDGDNYRVPKRDLAGVVQVLLQSHRLRIAKALPLAGVLQDELLNFRVKISLSGHDSYGAGADWRTANHDDLVLAVAMAAWHGEKNSGNVWPEDTAAFLAAAFAT